MEESPLADGYMPPDLSPEIRRFVEIIAAVKTLEHNLPLIEEIEEVENQRSQTIALVKWAEERYGKLWEAGALVEELKRYGVRVGQMCQRRKMQLLKEEAPEKKAMLPPKLPPPPFASPPASVLPEVNASVSEEQKEAIAKDIRAKARRRGEKIDEKAVQARLKMRLSRMRRVSTRNRKRAQGPRVANSPSDKFTRYWVREKKLLYQYFETSDLVWLAEFWWKRFHEFRAEEEKILSDNRQERERRKAQAELSKA